MPLKPLLLDFYGKTKNEKSQAKKVKKTLLIWEEREKERKKNKDKKGEIEKDRYFSVIFLLLYCTRQRGIEMQ